MVSPPGHVMIMYDATKDRHAREVQMTFDHILMSGAILSGVQEITVVGVLHRFLHPMGYQIKASNDSFVGTNSRLLEEEVLKKVDTYVNMLLKSAVQCDVQGISIEVKITAGNPIKKVILQEVLACKATWVILDKNFRRDQLFYKKQIPSKLAIIRDSLSLDILRSFPIDVDIIEEEPPFSRSKPVPLLQEAESIERSLFSIGSYSHSTSISSLETLELFPRNSTSFRTDKSRDHSLPPLNGLGSTSDQDKSGTSTKGDIKHASALRLVEKQLHNYFQQRTQQAPVLCAGCGTRTELSVLSSMNFSFPDIQLATNNFSKENLLGEGGYGHVYKGMLKDGQVIATKVRKEASTQGFKEFYSEVYVLSLSRHKNIVMLLGYCCKENRNILVYEYICNKSLEWHLFDKPDNPLEWHQRRDIAIGTAKGLRFLHEECRGGPIIHRDVRPGNILLTHDYVPMLGDFGLAKWKTTDDSDHTRILGTLGYLAPEYAENGIVSVRTDVYAYGIVLLQLISGRKVVDSSRDGQDSSLRKWAKPLIEKLALHELIDPRIEESYDTYELYHMAKTAYLCVQGRPEMRPSMGEVVRLLEGENDHFRHLADQFIPHYNK